MHSRFIGQYRRGGYFVILQYQFVFVHTLHYNCAPITMISQLIRWALAKITRKSAVKPLLVVLYCPE